MNACVIDLRMNPRGASAKIKGDGLQHIEQSFNVQCDDGIYASITFMDIALLCAQC